MLSREQPDRIHVAFDDHRLVANAGLILPVTLAHHLGLGELVDNYVDLGRAPGRANAGDKFLTLVASALAGGDCIAAADAMRAGGTGRVLGCAIKAPSTLGTFLRSFSWGHVRQLDRVSRELPAQTWQAGVAPGDTPLTFDTTVVRFADALDSDWMRQSPHQRCARVRAFISDPIRARSLIRDITCSRSALLRCRLYLRKVCPNWRVPS